MFLVFWQFPESKTWKMIYWWAESLFLSLLLTLNVASHCVAWIRSGIQISLTEQNILIPKNRNDFISVSNLSTITYEVQFLVSFFCYIQMSSYQFAGKFDALIVVVWANLILFFIFLYMDIKFPVLRNNSVAITVHRIMIKVFNLPYKVVVTEEVNDFGIMISLDHEAFLTRKIIKTIQYRRTIIHQSQLLPSSIVGRVVLLNCTTVLARISFKRSVRWAETIKSWPTLFHATEGENVFLRCSPSDSVLSSLAKNKPVLTFDPDRTP